ncbi:hypothetical protein DL96DRAFT_1591207 [Flagelloscypha sp. PMI_526]|nr:hypothetical protein DL96DRAFT_1591207 [Flagelloscypha sp. PMI_526]
MSKGTIVAAVDDTEVSKLKYAGSWAASKNVVDNIGFSGATLDSTLREGSASGSTITFEFDGTAIGFFGSLASASNKTAPKYTCRIDGVAFDENWKYGLQQTNQYPLCEQITLLDGHHIATLTIDSVSSDEPLLFDYAAYWPSPGAKLNDTVQQVQFNDSSITFSAGWSVYGDQEYHHYSSQKSTTVTMKFDGQAAVMYAFIPNGTFTAGKGSYVLDNGSPVSFTIPASKSTLNAGNHTVVVTDNSDHNLQSPMTASYFEVRGHPAGSNGGGSSGGLSTGVIAGIAVGGAAVLGAIAFLIFWFVVIVPRRKKNNASVEKLNAPPMTPPGPHGPQHSPSFQGGFVVPPPQQQQQYTPQIHASPIPSHNPSFPVPEGYGPSEASFNPYGPGPASSVAGSSTTGSHAPLVSNRYSQYSPPSSSAGPPNQQMLTRTDSGSGTRMEWRYPQDSGKGAAAAAALQPARFVEHQDSGVRMGDPAEEFRVVDVPPRYQEM